MSGTGASEDESIREAAFPVVGSPSEGTIAPRAGDTIGAAVLAAIYVEPAPEPVMLWSEIRGIELAGLDPRGLSRFHCPSVGGGTCRGVDPDPLLLPAIAPVQESTGERRKERGRGGRRDNDRKRREERGEKIERDR